MTDERGSKGTVVYRMKKFLNTERVDIRSCDIVLGMDDANKTWVLVRWMAR